MAYLLLHRPYWDTLQLLRCQSNSVHQLSPRRLLPVHHFYFYEWKRDEPASPIQLFNHRKMLYLAWFLYGSIASPLRLTCLIRHTQAGFVRLSENRLNTRPIRPCGHHCDHIGWPRNGATACNAGTEVSATTNPLRKYCLWNSRLTADPTKILTRENAPVFHVCRDQRIRILTLGNRSQPMRSICSLRAS